MGKRIFILSLVIIILLALVACNKDDKDENIEFDQIVYDYCSFRKGSYWVFKCDSVDNIFRGDAVYDTITVLYNNSFSTTEHRNHEMFDIPYNQNPVGRFSYRIEATYDNEFISYDFFDMYKPGDYYVTYPRGYSALYFTSLKEPGTVPTYLDMPYLADTKSRDSVEFVKKMDTYIVRGEVFNDIRHIKYITNFNNSDTVFKLNFYWAKHIGVIQYTDYSNNTWDLIDYWVNH